MPYSFLNFLYEKCLFLFLIIIIIIPTVTVPSRPPKNIRGYATSSTSIQLHWTAPDSQYRNGIISNYYVEIIEVDTNTNLDSHTSSDSQISITSLHPYYEYNCTIAAYTVGKGPSSSGLVIRTFQDGMLACHCVYIHVEYLLSTYKYSRVDMLFTCGVCTCISEVISRWLVESTKCII